MISDIHASPLSYPVTLVPGDKLTIVHTLTDDVGSPAIEHRLAEHTVDQETLFTHSIMFKLNGQWNHIIGTQETIDWLEGQCVSSNT